jgi:hypothetical protein
MILIFENENGRFRFLHCHGKYDRRQRKGEIEC